MPNNDRSKWSKAKLAATRAAGKIYTDVGAATGLYWPDTGDRAKEDARRDYEAIHSSSYYNRMPQRSTKRARKRS
jgi:hypothetical protein